MTNTGYADLVAEQLPDLTRDQILCEPMRKNTAPCIAYAAAKISAINPKANMIVAPSDHLILNEKEYNQIVNTGDLIFSNKEKKIKKNKKILFAVTVKNFQSIQLLGVEMYFEFIDNLFFLENFSKKNNFKTLIKLHPGVYKDLVTLKKMFTNLEFSTKNISEVFDDIFVTLSFSSTAIEDSLNSNCPVILLDRWKRYKHCDAEENVDNKNAAIYYVNNEIDLLKCINTINVSKKIDFDI